jgi:hypothetical protein
MNTNHLCATAPAGRRLDLEPAPPLQEGEDYGRFIVRSYGTVAHHLILPPGDVDDVNWDQAKTFAAGAGGELPTLCEQELLYLNLKDRFQPDSYWSSQEVRLEGGEAEIAYQGFVDRRYRDCTLKSDTMRARAIRRVLTEDPIAMIGDGNE